MACAACANGSHQTLYRKNDQLFFIKGLKDLTDEDAALIDDADLTATLFDGSDEEVDGFIDLDMNADTGSPPTVGDYWGLIDGAVFDAEPGDDYLLVVAGTSPTAGDIYLEIPVTVVQRVQ